MKIAVLFIALCGLSFQTWAQVSFTIASSPSVGGGPRGIAVADINGDGWLDVVTVSGNNNTFSVMTNDEKGNFALSSSPAIGINSNPVLAVDVNGDGKPDLVSASYSYSSLSILTNNGTGGFVLSSSPAVGANPILIAAADVNGDGKMDLITPNSGASSVSVLTNNGTGGFVTSGTYAVGYNPWAICAADVNGDGKADLITANYGDNTLSVLTNNGNGWFTNAGTYVVGTNPRHVIAADVNHDGKMDVICANYNANTITVLTNNGIGGFVTSASYSAGSNPSYLAAADVNGDGAMDLVVADNGANTVTVLTNDGSGGFVTAGTFTVGNNPWSVATADVNGDGKVDIITANYSDNTISVLTNGTPFPPSAPIITVQPTNQTIIVGGTATFTVKAVGTLPLSYQWSFNGTNLLNATNAMLILANVQFSEAGNYSVLVTNLYGSTNSVIAVLTVNPPPPCYPAPSGMVAWWPAEGNANDIITANNGILEGGLGFAPGEVGQAFNFKDTNGYVFVPASSRLNVGAGSGLTIEEWINPSNIVTRMPLFIWGTNTLLYTNVVAGSNILAGPILNTNNGHYYYLLQTNTWTNSEILAEQLGGHLATIRNLGEELWVSNTFANYGGTPLSLWIGLFDPSHDSGGGHAANFAWVDGEPVTFIDWAGGEPNNCSGNEYWGMIYAPYPVYGSGAGGQWNDITNTGANCGQPGFIPLYGVVEVTNPPAQWLWTSVGQPDCLYANLLDATNGAHVFFSVGGLLQSNVYQHIALTYNTNSGIAALYLNGTNVASTNLGSFVPNTTGDLYLGKSVDGVPTDIYSGGMDEVTIYNRALSQAEISGIYQAGSSGKCYPPTPPTIWGQPVGQTNLVGTNVTFSVLATGSLPLAYQWQFNGTNLLGATNSVLTLTNLSLNQAGNYNVIVTNYLGSVTSSPAILDVLFIAVELNGQIVTGTNTAISPATITLAGGYSGGYIFYTLDGSMPTTSSTLYTGPFSLTNSAVISTLALSSDFSQQSEGVPVTVIVVPTYILQTSIVGSGTLSTNPTVPGGVYASNTVVTLTATPAAHWSFAGWAGDTNGSQNPLSITMNGPHNIQAVFVQYQYPLTLTTPGGGTVTANGAVIGASTYYATDSVVTLAATPASGWVFLGWQGTVNSTNNPMRLVITQTNVIQGIFGTLAATNAAGGAVLLNASNPVPYGTALAISAVPNPGNYFVNWSGNLSGIYSPARYTATVANPTFGALFTPLPAGKFSLSVVVSGPGFVTYSPQTSYYSSNATVTLYPTPNSGNYFFGWSLGASGKNNPLTIQVTNNTVIQANFGVAPTVSISPLNQTVFAGSNAVITASAMGLSPLSYQWQNSQGIIPGATNATYTISNTQPANAGNYLVVVSSSVGSVTSAVATVTVIGAPSITNPPAPVTVIVGHTASYAVGAYGAPTLAYQWQFNGANLTGATNPVLTISNAFPANAGAYMVTVTNLYGSATSGPAALTVLPLTIVVPSKLVNGQFQIEFDTATGINYEVEYSTDLLNWTPWLTLGGNGQPLTLDDPAAGIPQRYYRIVLSPQ